MPKGKANVREPFLGEGSYGCILQPPVPCAKGKSANSETPVRSSKTPLDRRTVGKLFVDRNDFTQEVRFARVAAKIDPSGKKLLTPTKGCRVERKAVARHPGAKECEALAENAPKASYYQLNMPYGGYRLDKYVSQHRGSWTPETLLRKMMPVFEGVVDLAKAKYCHQDIKGPNLLLTPMGDIIIIDFGLMVPLSKIYKERNASRVRHTYFPYPPEFKVFWHMSTHAECKKTVCPWIVEEAGKNMFHFGTDRGVMYERFVPSDEWHATLDGLAAWLGGTPEKLASFADRIDVYSVGMVFIDLWKYLRVDGISERWRAFLRRLIHPDPRKRATPAEALALAQKMLAKKKNMDPR